MPGLDKPSQRAMLEAIKRIFETGHFVPKNHLREREDQRDIPHSVLLQVFASARIVNGPDWDSDYENWKVVIEGDVIDGDDPVRIVLGVDLPGETLFVVSCY